ncbi:kelch domain-containing protein 3-like [Aricia agestis]|uniref:kelch domain-containing protein 3-like n=1 Tax=Aricia agestis TaxID=91739 RepID=UPI001C205F07|nr:kelch domain-containing protein 3-like [Aricia agestis]
MWSVVESGGAGRAAPCARAKHSATLLGEHVYVLGGRGAGGSVPLRDFWRYSLASGIWERLGARGEPPPSLQEHSATAHGTRLYVFGGEAGALSAETPLWIYDTQTEEWRKLPGQTTLSARGRRGAKERAGLSPKGRRGHSAHGLRDCLLIYGGYKDLRGSTNELWAFHYESESWQLVRTANAGPARHRHAAALLGARLYVHGGQHDLRASADLWHYDTETRVWTQVRPGGRGARGAWPSARCGHAGLRAGAHLYIFGGESDGRPCRELWRFHFATETWEQMEYAPQWPSARVDGCALLVGGGGRGESAPAPARPPRPEPPAGFLREISKLSSFRRRGTRCAYSVLAPERDSTESLERSALAKSRSAHAIDATRCDVARDRTSVPDFADVALPTPVLTPAEAARLVYLDSEEEEELRRTRAVRFTPAAGEEDTSDYASAERVFRPASGFSNPHYLGPDVEGLGAALTPDSGNGDIELRELRGGRAAGGGGRLHLLLVGGKEPPHVALLQSPLSLWTYRLL